MKLVKRCNSPAIALLIILLALHVRFAFQKINFFIICTPYKKKIRHTWHSPKSPLDPKGGNNIQGSG